MSHTPRLPLTGTGGRLPRVSSRVELHVSPGVGGRCSGPVWGCGAGPGPPLAARPGGRALRSGSVTVVLRTPRAARRTAVAHSGHPEFIFCTFHRFGFLTGSSGSPHWFWLDNLSGWHFFFQSDTSVSGLSFGRRRFIFCFQI